MSSAPRDGLGSLDAGAKEIPLAGSCAGSGGPSCCLSSSIFPLSSVRMFEAGIALYNKMNTTHTPSKKNLSKFEVG